MSGTLYLVATPIGNLGDVSERARETFDRAGFIAAEDTRVTLKLLNHLGIKKPMVSYHEHNRVWSGEKIISRIEAGEDCALATDAGTPAISDPGEELVSMCAERGIEVVAIPGPCALVAALSVAGLPTQRFCFEGFLSTARRSRLEHLESLRGESRTMVFYEAPHKLRTTLEDMLECWGDRRISLCREITKLHEETLRMTMTEAIEHYRELEPRGEYVLVVEGAAAKKETLSFEEAAELALRLRAEGLSLKDASKRAAIESGHKRNALYQAALLKSGDKNNRE